MSNLWGLHQATPSPPPPPSPFQRVMKFLGGTFAIVVVLGALAVTAVALAWCVIHLVDAIFP